MVIISQETGEMNNHDYHLAFLARAIDDLPDAPCDACCFSFECVNPDYCPEYNAYVETGEVVRPPRKLPTGDS